MQITILILTIIVTGGIFAPMIPSNHWMVRGHLYLRFTYFVATIILLITTLIFITVSIAKIVTLIVLLSGILFCLKSILPFTFFYRKTLKNAKKIVPDLGIKLFVFNVYQSNKAYEKTISKINKLNPDIIFLLETDTNWFNAMLKLKLDYPHMLKAINEDTYGLLCFSKFPFKEKEIKYIVSADIPSIEVLIEIMGESVRIFGVHPQPPSPSEATYSTGKDKELLKTARKIQETIGSEHTILMGDFNDVAWSRISKAIKKITGMVDPRNGRGFYSTFPTYSPFKIPLDHVLCSKSFELVEFKVLENIGSDHYPLYAHLQLNGTKS